MALYTALSLDPPSPGKGLEGRFLGPFVARHFGDDFPRLDYVAAQKRDALPDSVTVEEFYVQSGALLGSSQAQRHYASLNYTHVARALVDRGEIGRAHVWTPVPNAHLVCRLLLEKKKITNHQHHEHDR